MIYAWDVLYRRRNIGLAGVELFLKGALVYMPEENSTSNCYCIVVRVDVITIPLIVLEWSGLLGVRKYKVW